jgi:preprotein translocase subunit SecD
MRYLLLFVAVALVGCGVCRPSPNLVFTVKPGTAQEDPAAVGEVLRQRVEGYGGSVTEVAVSGRIILIRAYLENHAESLPMILRAYKLEFAIADEEGLLRLGPKLADGAAQISIDDRGLPCATTRVALETALKTVEVPAGRWWALESVPGQDETPAQFCAYLLHPTELRNKDIVDAVVVPGIFGLEVSVEFSEEARVRFGEMSGANVDRRLAIVVDGDVLSAPTIMERIDIGRAVIVSGAETSDAAREAQGLVAALLASGLESAPVLLEVTELGQP